MIGLKILFGIGGFGLILLYRQMTRPTKEDLRRERDQIRYRLAAIETNSRGPISVNKVLALSRERDELISRAESLDRTLG